MRFASVNRAISSTNTFQATKTTTMRREKNRQKNKTRKSTENKAR